MAELNNAFVQEILGRAIAVMEEYPPDFTPADERFDLEPEYSIEATLKHARTAELINETMAAWPSGMMDVFMTVSAALGHSLSRFGIPGDDDVSPIEAMKLAPFDMDLMQLIVAISEVSEENSGLEMNLELEFLPGDPVPRAPSDRAVHLNVLMEEIQRCMRLKLSAYGHTLTALLGRDALRWLGAPARGGVTKIQPHELSRTNWQSLGNIRTQVSIERELDALSSVDPEIAKYIVTLSWTLVALSSFMNSGIFLSEADLRVSSIRDRGLTMSFGLATHTFALFESSQMINIARVLQRAFSNPLFTAADLMSIASGLARVKSIRTGHTDPIFPVREKFSLFLSHRGRDAKRELTNEVLDAGGAGGVFLDCLTLPQGTVNTRFVFESLSRSEKVLIIETAHFEESDWCRKERWFATALGDLGLVTCKKVELREAVSQAVVAARQSVRPRLRSEEMKYPITERILKDIDYWARAPNLHSLRDEGHPVDCFASIGTVIKKPEDAAQLSAEVLIAAIEDLFEKVLNADPDLEHWPIWSTMMQFLVATLSLRLSARSKIDVRRRVDDLNQIVRRLVEGELKMNATFRESPKSYFFLIAAAITITLSGACIDKKTAELIRSIIPKACLLRENSLLLDARTPGPQRDLHLRIVLLLVSQNIGSTGIIQNADDAVHELEIDGNSLKVIPCVTIHPGMEELFHISRR